MTGFDALQSDWRYARRSLARNSVFTTASIGIVALSVAFSAVLFAVVKGALIRPWPYRGYERLVTIRGTYPTLSRTGFSLWSAAEIEDLRAATDVFDHVIAGDARNVNLTYDGRPERVRAAVITPDAFEMLGVPAKIGRALAPADAAQGATPAVVLSYRFWQTRLGRDPFVLGRVLRVADTPYQIVGVMPEGFVFWDRDLWMPLTLGATEPRTQRRYYAQGRLREGLSVEAATNRLALVARRLGGDHPEQPEYAGMSFEIRRLVDDVLRDLRPLLYVLLASVGLLMLVASANLGNAMLARAVAREGELAIRRALGASRVQIIRQLLIESATIGAVGGLAGAAAAAYILPYVIAAVPYGYIPAEAQIAIDWTVVAAASAAAVASAVGFTVAPANRAARVDPGAALKTGNRRTGSRRSQRIQRVFIVAQLSLAIVVVGVAAGAFVSVRAAVRRNPGFDTDRVWTMRVALPARDTDLAGTFDRIVKRITGEAGVATAVVASAYPSGALPTSLVAAAPAAENAAQGTDADVVRTGAGFFEQLRIPVEGRTFLDSDRAAAPAVAIVSRKLAERLWPGGAPVGGRLAVADGDSRIVAAVVGVATDISTDPARDRERPTVFLPFAQQPSRVATIGIQSRDLTRIAEIAERAVRAESPDAPVFDVAMLEQSRRIPLGPQLLAVLLLGSFGVSVVVLSAIGVYAVVSHSVEDRRQELRIRLMFGAKPLQLFADELARIGTLIAISAAAGGACGAAALRIVKAQTPLFHDVRPWPIAVAMLTVAFIAIAATAVPAFRGSRSAIQLLTPR